MNDHLPQTSVGNCGAIRAFDSLADCFIKRTRIGMSPVGKPMLKGGVYKQIKFVGGTMNSPVYEAGRQDCFRRNIYCFVQPITIRQFYQKAQIKLQFSCGMVANLTPNLPAFPFIVAKTRRGIK
ncbi:MAG: hypothetical protein Q7J98_08185 [Kiritimatiellia bacterium]|nr:hypothetical protein [Kiritimatiellia bacterium]